MRSLDAKFISQVMGISERAVRNMAQREGWPFEVVKSKGGPGGTKKIYPLSTLPDQIKKDHLIHAVKNTPELPTEKHAVPALAAPKIATLKKWQRDCMDARLAMVRMVQELTPLVGVTRSIRQVVDMARSGDLPPHIQLLVPVANQRGGKTGKRTLSERSLFRWVGLMAEGQFFTVLAPKDNPVPTPPWAAHLLKAWRNPQKTPLADAIRTLQDPGVLPAGISPPSYGAARRWLRQVGSVEKMRGRLLPNQLRAVQPFVRRDTSNLLPTDFYTADGQTFDAEVAHPHHGRPFRPEVTLILDVATRLAVGWSVGLAESALVVLDAISHASRKYGIPAGFYVDKGSGYVNELMTDTGTGLMKRMGCTMHHSVPRNPQARGIIERAHQTILIRAARRLPTYVGKDMDKTARQIVYKQTRADGTGLPSWRQFVDHLAAEVESYNNLPHSALDKITDSVTGNRRHLSPTEMWKQAVENGFTPVMPVDEEQMFRPHTKRKVRRGEINLFGNIYFSRELTEYHGDMVHVGYDIHDPAKVYIEDIWQRPICVADLDGNRKSYYPLSVVERNQEQRSDGRKKRLESHLDEVEAERTGTQNLLPDVPGIPEHAREDVERIQAEMVAEFREQPMALLPDLEEVPVPAGITPAPPTPQAKTPVTAALKMKNHEPESQRDEFYRWCRLRLRVNNGEPCTPPEEAFLNAYPTTHEFNAEWSIHLDFDLKLPGSDGVYVRDLLKEGRA